MFKIRVLSSTLKKVTEERTKEAILKRQLVDSFKNKFSHLTNITFNVVNTQGRNWNSPVYVKDVQNPNVIHFYIGNVCLDGPIVKTELGNITSVSFTWITSQNGSNYASSATLPIREDIVYFSELKHCYAIGRTIFLIKEVIANSEIDAILEYIKDPSKYKQNINSSKLLRTLKSTYTNVIDNSDFQIQSAENHVRDYYSKYLKYKKTLEEEKIRNEALKAKISTVNDQEILDEFKANITDRADVESVDFKESYIKISIKSLICSDSRKNRPSIIIPACELFIFLNSSSLSYAYRCDEYKYSGYNGLNMFHPHVIYSDKPNPEKTDDILYRACLGDIKSEIESDGSNWRLADYIEKLINLLYYYNSSDTAGGYYNSWPRA